MIEVGTEVAVLLGFEVPHVFFAVEQAQAYAEWEIADAEGRGDGEPILTWHDYQGGGCIVAAGPRNLPLEIRLILLEAGTPGDTLFAEEDAAEEAEKAARNE
jgi:hypothetical protein